MFTNRKTAQASDTPQVPQLYCIVHRRGWGTCLDENACPKLRQIVIIYFCQTKINLIKLRSNTSEVYLMISWPVQMSPWGPMQSAFDDKQPKNISEVDTSATIWTLSWHGHMGNKWATNGQQMCNKWAHGQQMGIYWKCDLPNSPFACPRAHVPICWTFVAHVPICCPCAHLLHICCPCAYVMIMFK